MARVHGCMWKRDACVRHVREPLPGIGKTLYLTVANFTRGHSEQDLAHNVQYQSSKQQPLVRIQVHRPLCIRVSVCVRG